MNSKRKVGLASILLLAGVSMFVGGIAAASGQESSSVYDANCALCHQKAGVGLAGQFPRLAGRVGEIAASDAGRRYLIEVSLFGMAGKLEVDGSVIIGVMPPFAILSDEEIATTLNYLAALEPPAKAKARGKAKSKASIKAADVAKVRSGPTLSPGQVLSNRAGVVTEK